MKHRFLTVVIIALIALPFVGCTSEDGETKTKDTVADKKANTTTISTVTAKLEIENAPLAAELKEAGYRTVSYVRFPAQETSVKGAMAVYQGSGNSGGLIYVHLDRDTNDPSVCWLWHFNDRKPESVQKQEINEDGLWDLRIRFSDGETVDYLQGEAFTLFTKPREGLVAINGISSSGEGVESPYWLGFDGIVKTTWKTKTGDAFVEVMNPLGLSAGILTVHAPVEPRPKSIEVIADGKKVQEVELEDIDGVQTIKLDASVSKAETIRLIVRSSYGADGIALIAELDLK